MQKLVLFDFDGVLVDTLDIAYGINLEVQPDLTLEKYKSFFEGNIHTAIADGRKKHIPDFDEKSSFRARELKIPEDIKQLVVSSSKDAKLTIVSSSSTKLITEILDREGMSKYFSDILGSDAHQSKVVKIKMLLDKYKVTPENSVFITDTLGDIREADDCGVKSIAVTWGFHSIETLKKGNPVKIVENPKDLLKAIGEIL